MSASAKTFRAPWSKGLKVISGIATVLLMALPFAAFTVQDDRFLSLFLITLPIAVLLGSGLTAVFGYRIESDALIIERPWRQTRIPLTSIQKAEPADLRRSLRIFGNGGLFAFAGWFLLRGVGRYQAFLTDPEHAVMLTTAKRRIAVSPENPQAFIAALREARPDISSD